MLPLIENQKGAAASAVPTSKHFGRISLRQSAVATISSTVAEKIEVLKRTNTSQAPTLQKRLGVGEGFINISGFPIYVINPFSQIIFLKSLFGQLEIQV